MLVAGGIYHVYNREYIGPVTKIYGWCLLDNHFHLMLRMRSEKEIVAHFGLETFQKFGTFEKFCSKQFSNFFSSYAQSYNKVYSRKGNLFQANMKYKEVSSARYFTQLLLYIHNNAARHGFVQDFRDWPHSSWWQYQYRANNMPIIEERDRIITQEVQAEVFKWFGSEAGFITTHLSMPRLNSAFE